MQQNKVGEQKSYRLFGHFSLLIFVSTTLLFAGSFEDFKKSQNTAFAQYSDTRDKAFKSYLESQWEEYNAQKSIPLYEKPKPKNIPSTIEKQIKTVGPKVSVYLPKEEQEKSLDMQEDRLVVLKTSFIKKDINFDFYGTKLGFNIDEKIKSANYYPQNQKGISNFFDLVASSEYDYLVLEIQNIAKEMELNDWGINLLVSKLSDEIYSSKDNITLFKWFLLNKLGYGVKVGLASGHVVLMYYSDKQIYAAPSYRFGSKKYYVLDHNLNNSSSLYSYPKEYPDANKALDLSLENLPKLATNLQTKTLSFKQLGKEYSVSYEYNQNLIDFMATYPQADYDTFFNAAIDEQSYMQIAKSLKKYVDGMQASKAINFVLNFVQNAFVYETDSEQFGYEKVMFAQETLYYEKSDCEDRAILFSLLVKKIFSINVVGVKYSDHMATALYIPMNGDNVNVYGKKYILADPTYINANIGQSMPRYKSKMPENFIVVKMDE